MSMRGLFGSLLVALSLASTAAWAGEFVEIEGGSGTERVRLVGYLAKPAGPGPFPAVVLLHGCGGFHSSMISWADRVSRYGYVTLAVDSFGPRGLDNDCGGIFPHQTADAPAALRYLAAKPFVRPSHVALMGFSQGGSAVLANLEKPDSGFRAGIAFYPLCRFASGLTTAPLLVLIGGADTWAPSSACEAMAAGRTELGAPRTSGDRSKVELVVYPGAHHSFDVLDLAIVPTRGTTMFGHRVEFNEDAMKDAMVRVREFLERTLGQAELGR
jgi:dienelactone hydrolase